VPYVNPINEVHVQELGLVVVVDVADADPTHLLVVRDDVTGFAIGPVDEAGRRLLAEGVLTLPELLRRGETRPALSQRQAFEAARGNRPSC
jgi:hypothetical protein